MKDSRVAVFAVFVATAAFGCALALREIYNPWLTSAATAIGALLISVAVLAPRLRALLEFRWSSALAAFALGVILVLGTHASFRLLVELFPAIGSRVVRLYGEIGVASPGVAVAVPLICLVVAAEELLWRGAALDWLRSRCSDRTALVCAVGLYAVPQVIARSPILVATAIVLGAVLTLQRLRSGRLTEPLITHATWSTAIFGFVPLA